MIKQMSRWRTLSVALTIVTAFTFSIAAPAFAAQQGIPGEGTTWQPENAGYPQIQTSSTISEAQQTARYRILVWRTADSRIQISLNSGRASQFPTFQTAAAPQVVAYGPNRFMVFITGLDGRIYYSQSPTTDSGVNLGDAARWDPWVPVQSQRTSRIQSVSVTQGGSSPYELFLAYRSPVGNSMYVTYFDGVNWNGANQIPQAQSEFPPSVAYSPAGRQIYIAHTGVDRRVYVARGGIDPDTWSSWQQLGGLTATGSPTIAATTTSNAILLSALDLNRGGRVSFNRAYTWAPTAWSGWSPESRQWQTRVAVSFFVVYATIYILLRGNDGQAYWKNAFTG